MPGGLGPDFAYVFASRSSAESGVSWKEMRSLQKSGLWFLKWEWERNTLWGPKYLREASRVEIQSARVLWFKSLSYKDSMCSSVWNRKATYYNTMQTFPQGTREPLTRWTRKFPTLWKSWEKVQTFSEVLASTLTSSVRHTGPPKSENSWGLSNHNRNKLLSTAIARTRCQKDESKQMHLKMYLKYTCISQQAYPLGSICSRDITQVPVSGNST